MKITLPENIALVLHPHVDGKLCLRDDKKCCFCIISPSLAMEGQPGKRHNVRAQQQEEVYDWVNPFY